MAKWESVYARRINQNSPPGTGKLEALDIDQVFATWGEECFYCRVPLSYGNLWSNGSLDHLVPFALGGRNVLRNLVPCCKTCNNRKGEKFVYLNYTRDRLVFRHITDKPKIKGW